VRTGRALRQRHFGNGSVVLEVDALLLPPPEQAERGTLLLDIDSPDGQHSWQVQVDVSTPPPGSRGAGSCPWQPLASSGGACAAEGESEGGAASAPPLVIHTLLLVLDAPLKLWWPHDFGQQPLHSQRQQRWQQRCEQQQRACARGRRRADRREQRRRRQQQPAAPHRPAHSAAGH
jgi:hypothetical protein